MLECPNCKKQLQDGMKFCDNCGTPLAGVAPQPQQFQQQAPQPQPQQFQQQAPQPQQFQQQYQQPQYQQQYQQPPYQAGYQQQPQWGAPPPQKKSKKGLIIGIIIALIVIAGGTFAALFFLKIGPFASSGLDKLKNAQTGETVTFGKYEQDANNGNGKEDIKWLVLAKEDDKILLLSEKVLDAVPYNETKAAITWEKSSIRTFCNSTFLNEAFDQKEQESIRQSDVSADANPQKTTSPQGNTTQDKVFLLSAVEMAKYCTSNDLKKGSHTEYSRLKGGYVGDNGEAVYWLRTIGTMDSSNKCATIVQGAGTIGYNGRPVDETQAVRPAIWVSIK